MAPDLELNPSAGGQACSYIHGSYSTDLSDQNRAFDCGPNKEKLSGTAASFSSVNILIDKL